MLEQQASQFGEQLKIIDQQIHELSHLKENIIKLNELDENEMFSEVGKGIYVKGTLNKKQMLVDVGHKILVPKTSKDIQEIVESQVEKFADVKKEIAKNIDLINSEVDRLINEVRNGGKNTDKNNNKDNKIIARAVLLTTSSFGE